MSTDSAPLPAAVTNAFAVVLAAGSASRFGATKQLARYHGEPLVRQAVRVAEQVCGRRSLLLTGCDWQDVSEACRPLQGFFVHNEEYRQGIGNSIACAVRAVRQAADAILLLLADQPLITDAHLRSLLGTWAAAPDTIVASTYAATLGPPVVFPSRFFPELLNLRGDTGARSILQANGGDVRAIAFADANVDIDYPDDLGRLA